MRPDWLRATTLLLLAGCAVPPAAHEAPKVLPTVQVPLASPADGPPMDPIVSVAAARAPATPVIDGDLGEWGTLPSPLPSRPAPPTEEDPEPKAKPVSPTTPRNPPGASSHLVLALTDHVALIAVELAAAAREGIWLGIGSAPADLPPPGSYQGNAGYVVVGVPSCATTLIGEDEGMREVTNTPEAVAACQSLLVCNAERKANHVKRFARVYKIDREGVHGASAGGELSAIPTAKWASKVGVEGATTMEIALPLDALPRVAEAPVKVLRLMARAATSAEPPALEDAWVWIDLPEPVSFEPNGALRAHAFTRALDYGLVGLGGRGSGGYRLPRGLSYQPGEPSHLEVVDSPDCMAIAAHEVTLYEKEASFGDVEVGQVTAPRGDSCVAELEPWLGTFVKGKLVDIEASGSPRGTITRGGELHVLSFVPATDWSSTVAGTWSAIAFAPDGTRRKVLIEPIAGLKNPGSTPLIWDSVAAFAGKDLDGFGWRGARGKRGLEATWHWDEARKVYRGTERAIPPPTPKKIP